MDTTTPVTDLDLDLNGSSGEDTLNGWGGNDRLFGGASSDIMNGGAGSDLLNGGSGGDMLIYNLAANSAAGTADVYMGGSGKDTLCLQFTRAEWLNPQVQSQIANYLTHLSTVTNVKTGEVSNGVASDFVFTFGTSKLTVQMMENLKVSVDGVELSAVNDLVDALDDSAAAVEDGPAIHVSVLTNDTVPDLVASVALVTPPPASHGSATLVMPTGNPATWYFEYVVNSSYYQYLGQGDTATDTFTYRVVDANGDSDTATVTITITGTNDGPVLSDTTDPTAVAEAADAAAQNLAAITGSFSVSDLDVGDTLTASVVGSPVVKLGTETFVLPAGATALIAGGAFTLTGSTSNGAAASIGYSYDPGAANLDFLRAGQSLTITYTVQVSDGTADSGTQDVTFTITGTNDAPVLSDTTDPGAVLELTDASAQNLTAITGSFSVSDLDVGDTLTASVVGGATVKLDGNPFTLPAGATALIAGGTFSVTGTTSNGGAASIGYSYDPGAASLDFLRAGQSLTITYTVQVSDGTATSGTQDVSFTITGTNDAPVLSDTTDPTAVAELTDASAQNLTAITGSFSVSDLDVGDTLTASVVGSPVVKLGTETFVLPAGAAALTAAGAFSVTGATSNGGAASIGYSYDPGAANLDFLRAGQSLTITYAVKVSDGTADSGTQEVSFTITGTNDAPDIRVVTTDSDAKTLTETNAGLTTIGTLTVTDAELADTVASSVASVTLGGTTGSLTAADVLGFLSVSPASALAANTGDANNLTWTFNSGTQAFDYLNAGQSLTLTYTVQSSDGNGGIDTQQVTITIDGTTDNQNPVAANDRIIVSNNTAVTISTAALLANDTDIDGLALAITSVSGPGITGLTLNPNGTISFTSAAVGGSFQYTVSDGAGGSATATVTIAIQSIGGANTQDNVNLSAESYQASYIDGRGGADNLTGGAPGDVLIGGAGDDTLVGGAGNDTLRGGLGNNDVMDGGASNEDMLDFSDGTAGLVNFLFVQGAGLTTIPNASSGGLGNNDRYQNMEGVIGTNLADAITGSASNDILRGGGGNDTIDGAAGTADLIDFSDGTAGISFTLVQGAGTSFNATTSGLGVDTYQNIEGVIGTAFADTLTGSASADALRGGGGNDVLSGLGGNDRISGGTGADTLSGGTGADTFVFDTAPNAVDTVTDFQADLGDKIELSASVFTALTTASGSPLAAAEFASLAGSGASASVGAGVHLIYDSTTGNLYYDADGGTAAGRTLFATLSGVTGTFDQNDITVGQ